MSGIMLQSQYTGAIVAQFELHTDIVT